MAESTLSLTYSELEAEVGFFCGFGRGTNYGETAWSTRQQQGITDCVKSGLRMFYFPGPLPGEQSAYDWSFLRPTTTIVLPDQATSVPLPDDFGGLEGEVRLIDSGRASWAIKQTSEQQIYQRRFNVPEQTGQPEFCAVRQTPVTNKYRGQRSELLIFPTADQEYTLQLQYYLLPDALSVSFPYAMGGTTHSETIKAAVKAAAELHQDNMKGPMNDLFIDRMRASISLDRRSKPQNFGMNLDASYNAGGNGYRYMNGIRVPILYNGVSPG
jgi:hypothetical protein